MSENIWKKPPDKIKLSENEIHVWRAQFSKHISNIKHFRKMLSEDEIIRADKFYFEKDRNSFTISRGFLRIILGKYLNIDPEKLLFKYNQYGKPELNERISPTDINFNLSHSEDLVLYAISCKRQLGIDVEFIRKKISYKEICLRFFSHNEVKALCDLPDNLHKEAFFNCWTRKEAYIKAKGKGLAIPLNKFDVSLAPNEPALILDTRDDPESKDKLSLYELFPGEGYKAAIVAEGHDLKISTWEILTIANTL